MNDLKFRIVRSGISFRNDFDGVLYTENTFGHRSVLSNPMFEKHEEHLLIPETSILRFTKENIQQLMDDLWSEGVRPSQLKDGDKIISATEKHLQDMRTIVFDHFLKGKGSNTNEKTSS